MRGWVRGVLHQGLSSAEAEPSRPERTGQGVALVVVDDEVGMVPAVLVVMLSLLPLLLLLLALVAVPRGREGAGDAPCHAVAVKAVQAPVNVGVWVCDAHAHVPMCVCASLPPANNTSCTHCAVPSPPSTHTFTMCIAQECPTQRSIQCVWKDPLHTHSHDD